MSHRPIEVKLGFGFRASLNCIHNCLKTHLFSFSLSRRLFHQLIRRGRGGGVDDLRVPNAFSQLVHFNPRIASQTLRKCPARCVPIYESDVHCDRAPGSSREGLSSRMPPWMLFRITALCVCSDLGLEDCPWPPQRADLVHIVAMHRREGDPFGERPNGPRNEAVRVSDCRSFHSPVESANAGLGPICFDLNAVCDV